MNLADIYSRSKAALYSVLGSYSTGNGFRGLILEPFAGAWQKNVVCESNQNILAFSAVYACVSLISNDISKLRVKLIHQNNEIWEEVTNLRSPFLSVLNKPNRYQTRQQFISQWITSKLLYGNAYVLKERDNRGVVIALYVLDARYVVPLMADDGSVYYQVTRNILAGVQDNEPAVPSSEIIHDRMITLFHPLVGVTPIYACGAAATQGIRIQANSETFFGNMSRPSGQLTSPNTITDETAKRLKESFEANYAGSKIGRLLVTGDGLKYEPMSMPASDSQLIEQLRWTVEDVGRAFQMPGYKLGLQQPTITSIGALNQEYYNQTLQTHVESLEALIDEGLDLPIEYQIELDLDGLLRMDPLSRAETYAKLQGVAKIDELRLKENYPRVPGGNAVYLQQQNYSTEALSKRDAQEDPFASTKPAAPVAVPALPAPTKDIELEDAKLLADELIARFVEVARG